MRPVTTLILLATCALLGLAIWWTGEERVASRTGSSGATEMGKGLARFDSKALTRIVVRQPSGTATLEKREGYWHFASPIADRADPDAVAALIDELGHLTVLDRIAREEVGSRDDLTPAALGLSGDQVTRVELTETFGDGAGRTHAILLGKPSPLADSTYARIPDDEDRASDVFVVKGTPADYLGDPVASLRDRRLFHVPADQIVQINLRLPSGELELKRRIVAPTTDWTLTKPLNTLADRERIESLLAGVSALRVDAVLPDETPEARPVPSPLPEGWAVLEFWRFGSDSSLTLVLRPGSGGAPADAGEPVIEASVSDRPSRFQVRSRLLDTLPKTPGDFRDPHLARIPPGAVFGVTIDSRGNPPVRLRTARATDGVKWFSERNGAEEPANVVPIAALLEGLNSEKVLRFLPATPENLAGHNLNQPAVTIAISHYERLPETAPDGAEAGGTGRLGIANQVIRLGFTESDDAAPESHRLFAHVEGQPDLMEISPAFREKVPTHPLKWKDLKLLTFNPISLRAIERRSAGDGEAPLRLLYDYRLDRWTAETGSTPLPEGRIDKEAARRLRNGLGSLTANRWLTPSPLAFQAMESPDAEFRVTLASVDRATGSTRETVQRLRFAKASELSYYGRLDDSPDLFEIGRDTYRDLVAPLLSGPAAEVP